MTQISIVISTRAGPICKAQRDCRQRSPDNGTGAIYIMGQDISVLPSVVVTWLSPLAHPFRKMFLPDESPYLDVVHCSLSSMPTRRVCPIFREYQPVRMAPILMTPGNWFEREGNDANFVANARIAAVISRSSLPLSLYQLPHSDLRRLVERK